MTQRSMTETNRISTVIDALQLGKKTGILAVERGTGQIFEEGTIVFTHGQMVQASIGFYRGRDAAIKLLSWQACRFTFTSTQPDPMRETPPIPRNQTNANRTMEDPGETFDRNQHRYSNIQDEMSLQPLLNVHKEALNEILLTLDRQGFSRIHRRLLLLIDGKRSVRELSTLIGRKSNETLTLLTELEQAGFIQL